MANNNIKYIDFSDFRLDLKNERLLIAGKPSALTHKAFQTLRLLVENRGRVVEKDEIFSKLWSDSFVEETNLTQYIYVLRKTLASASRGESLIETIPRRGYRFNGVVREVIEPESETGYYVSGMKSSNDVLALPDEIFDQDKLLDGNFSCGDALKTFETGKEFGIIAEQDENLQTAPKLKQNTIFSIRHHRVYLYSGLIIFLLSAAVVTGYYLSRFKKQNYQTKPKSIAVLPFRPIGDESRNDKLGLGMADAIIVRLSQQKETPVRPTSAIFRFTDPSNKAAQQAGRELGVDAVLEGTVQCENDRIRVSVQMLNVEDGKSLWADSFNEKFTDIFAVQDAISAKVTRQLSLNLNHGDNPAAAPRETTSIEAYQAYLLGVYFWNTRTDDGLRKAVQYFNRAIEIDPQYAEAYAGLADTYNMQIIYRYEPREEAGRKAKEAALTALELNEKVAQAHIALSQVQLYLEKDYRAARRSLERAIELAPFNATARLRYGWVLLRAGQIEDAVREMRLGQEYDPLSAVNNAALCGMLIFNRNYDEAISFCDRAEELNPKAPTVSHSRAIARFLRGEREKAILELETYTKANTDSAGELGVLGYFYAQIGDTRKAVQIIEVLQRQVQKTPMFYNDLAVISYSLGRKKEAFEFLEKSIENGSFTNLALFDPTFDEIKADPLYEELIKKKNYKDQIE